MKILSILVTLLLAHHTATAQDITGNALLDKAIDYHDPNKNWSTFNDTLFVTMKTPKQANRDSKIVINLPQEYFYISAKRDTIHTEFTVEKDACTIRLNGVEDLSEEQLNANNLSCDRATMYKNYYTYLYGLPMKLKDPGTNVDDYVERKVFKEKEYLVLKVSYDKTVGSDVWFFYFDPETYAMEIYQFFKTDDTGQLIMDSGEYIILKETKTVNSIKMPKIRAWYYNKDDGYLGTDMLQE